MTHGSLDIGAGLNTKLPWQVLARLLSSPSPDHQLWWNNLSPVIGSSLDESGYSIDAQYRTLLMIHHAIIPALGPFPHRDRTNVSWVDCMANSTGPLDISVNYQNDAKCTFRLTLEPVGPYAGTESDLVNETAGKQLLQVLCQLQPGMDLAWLDHLDPMIVKNREARQYWKAISHLPCKSQTVIGLDFHKDSSFTVKPYLSPLVKAVATGADFFQSMFQYLATVPNAKLNLALLEQYMGSSKHSFQPEKTYLSFDCKSPSESRVKIYTAMDMTSLEEVYDLWSLGGRLSGPDIEKGFEIVTKMWTGIYPKPLAGGERRTSLTVNFNWELSPKDGSVAPKAYFLVDRDLDANVSDALVSLFTDLAWHSHVKTHLALDRET
ncbi:hypothetical protein FE257_010365 [Aspergillus nanangensis]|uniref:Uncharacterized protein n=1 Tax=Aspergillus nanangensis TaxID=2582783 RepID=A0AAD4CKF7_ASPNN|nr:hypothetical protein FE257_010365 [Aspergillus nanangensis]